MISTNNPAISTSQIKAFPKDIFLLDDFKDLVSRQFEFIKPRFPFRPKLYAPVDYIIPVLYSMTAHISIHHACEELNELAITAAEETFNSNIKVYADGKRKRRLVPHQTSVNKFLAHFTEKTTKEFFGTLLTELNERIRKRVFKRNPVRFIADNTKYPYYGKEKTDTEIKIPKLPGTSYGRMFQGHSIQASGIHLFVEFNEIRKGMYRSAPVVPSIEWLKFLGYEISYALLDREFYRATLCLDLKRTDTPFVMPSKKFAKIIKEIRDYLYFNRDLVDDYLFSQSANQYPNQSSVTLHLAFIGDHGYTADELRLKYHTGQLYYKDFIGRMKGFFSTISVWASEKRYCGHLIRCYKIRWNIETGFSKLNSIHESYRYRHSEQQLIGLYIRSLIYNNWQLWRKYVLETSTTSSDGALNLYIRKYNSFISNLLLDHVLSRLKSCNSRKKEVYFM